MPVVLGIAVLVAAVAVTDDVSGGSGTWGHANAPTGLVATRPLPDDVRRLAWERRIPAPSAPSIRTVVRTRDSLPGTGLVEIGELLVDTRRGEVVGRHLDGEPIGDGTIAVGDGPLLEIWDIAAARLVDSRRVQGVSATATVRPVGVMDDRTVVVTVDDEATGRLALVDDDGGAAFVPGVLGTVVATHGDSLLLVADDEGVARWIDAPSGDTVAASAPPDAGGPFVPLGRHLVRAVGDELVAIDRDGGVTRRGLVGPAVTLEDVSVLGASTQSVVVAGRDPSSDGDWLLATVSRPPWTDGDDSVRVVASVPAPAAGVAWSPLVPGAQPGMRRPGDAAVLDGLVVVHDVGERRLRALDLRGATRWSVPARPDVGVSAAAGHVAVSTSVPGGARVRLLSIDDGTERWSGWSLARSWPPVEGVVAAHDGAFVLQGQGGGRPLVEAVSGDNVPGVATAGRPLGVVESPDGGSVLAREQSLDDGSRVVVADRRFDLAAVDGTLPVARAYDEGTLVVERYVGIPPHGRVTVELVGDDGSTSLVEGARGVVGSRGDRLAAEPFVHIDHGIAVIDTATGERRAVVAGADDLSRVGPDRLIAQGGVEWWLTTGQGADVGDRRDLPSGVLIVGDGLVATAERGTVTVLDATDGSVRWRADGAPVAPSSMVFAGDQLLVGTRDGRVVTYDHTGEPVTELDAGDGPVTGIAWEADTLLVVVDGVFRGFRSDVAGGPRDAVDLP